MHLRSFCYAGSWLLLLQDAAAIADDQLIAGPHLAFDDFRVGTVVETELDGDRCRLSVAQDPEPRPTIQRRTWFAGGVRHC